VSRHGYRFVVEVIEEEDDVAQPVPLPHAAQTRVDAELRQTLPDTRGWTGASAGGAVAGVAAGGLGGLILAAAPGSVAPIAIAPVLAVVGGVCGGLGGAGIGAGLAFAEERARSHRTLAMIGAAALGGGLVGAAVQWLSRWALAALLGLDVNVGGGLEGVVIGAAAGAGYAIAPRSVLLIAGLCGFAGLALTLTGHPLVGGTIHAIADAADGSRATLAPLGRLIGEPDFGPVSRTILACGEAAVFGVGLARGLRRRRIAEDRGDFQGN
jgi:hypothetical protein